MINFTPIALLDATHIDEIADDVFLAFKKGNEQEADLVATLVWWSVYVTLGRRLAQDHAFSIAAQIKKEVRKGGGAFQNPRELRVAVEHWSTQYCLIFLSLYKTDESVVDAQ